MSPLVHLEMNNPLLGGRCPTLWDMLFFLGSVALYETHTGVFVEITSSIMCNRKESVGVLPKAEQLPYSSSMAYLIHGELGLVVCNIYFVSNVLNVNRVVSFDGYIVFPRYKVIPVTTQVAISCRSHRYKLALRDTQGARGRGDYSPWRGG